MRNDYTPNDEKHTRKNEQKKKNLEERKEKHEVERNNETRFTWRKGRKKEKRRI